LDTTSEYRSLLFLLLIQNPEYDTRNKPLQAQHKT
jgi:hypothetical protein